MSIFYHIFYTPQCTYIYCVDNYTSASRVVIGAQLTKLLKGLIIRVLLVRFTAG